MEDKNIKKRYRCGGNQTIYKIFVIFSFIVFLSTSFANESEAAVTNLGRTYFGDNAATTGVVRFKSLNASPSTWSAQANTAAASADSFATWVVAKTAPTRDEQMLGILRINGTLDIQTCTTNSGTCTARWNNPGTQAGTPVCSTSATAGTCVQPFDIGYEALSGRGLVAYGDTTAGKFYYALWNGTSWSPNSTPGTPGVSNEVALSGGTLIPRWIRVIPTGENLADDRSNRIIILVGSSVNVSDAAYTLDAFYWDGSTMSSVTNLSTTLGNCTKGRCFDGNWQGNINFVASYTNNGVSETRYRKYVVGTGWGADTQAYTNAATPIFVSSSADPTSSRIIVTTVTSGNDVRTAVWRSDDATDGWTVCASGGCPDTAIETVGGNQGLAVFERFGGQGLISFNDAGTTADSSYWVYTPPSTWSATAVTGITTTDDALNTKAWTMPNNDDVMIGVQDVDCRLRMRLWTGAAWDTTTVEMNNGTTATLSNYGVTCPLSNTPGVAPIGIPFAYDFAPKIYSPWSMNWRWYDGTDTANSPTTALALENATSTGVDGYAQKLRLRFNVTELSAGVNQTDARKKLQYSTTSPDTIGAYWADVDNTAGSGEWRYFDCNGGSAVCDDGTVVSANVLTGSTVAGWWNTSKDSAASVNMDHASSSVRELEFPIEANNTATGTIYYFRMYDVDQLTPVFRRQDSGATPCAGSTVCQYPRLTTATSTYNLEAYRFYENNDGTQVGNNPLAAQNATTTLSSTGQEFRLRLLTHIGVAGLGVNKGDFKLQFAEKGGGSWCGAPAGSWTDVTSGTAISFLNNATPADGSAMTASTTDPTVGHTVVAQTYEESNPFTNPNAIPSGQDGKWDFSLYDNGATASATYCLRIVSLEPGSSMTYTTYPAVIMSAAATAPTVTTNQESSVTQTSATLNGNIDSTGGTNATVRGFAWGTNSALSGGDTATTTENGSFGTGAFTSVRSGLTCNTTYYARAYATNPSGTGYGAIDSFTTSPCNPTVTTQSASSVTATTATLNGNITNTGGSNVTTRGFAYSTNSSLSTGVSTTTENGSFGTGAFTYSASGLTGNTTYYARAYGINPGGTGYGSISAGFLTLPDVPGTPTGGSITATTLTVSWTAPTGGAVTYKIERCTGSGCSSFSELQTGIAGLSYADSGLSPSTVYRYRVRGTNASGDGVYATSADITTSATASTELSAYRFFSAADSYTPGSALANQDTAATLSLASDPFRLRLLIHFGTSNIAINERSFKLQFAERSGTCDTSFTGESYADITSGTVIAYRDTTGLTDNTALGAQADLTHGADTIINQTYEEANNFTNSQSTISSGQDGKWDFSLIDNGATQGSSYCIRVVQSDGSVLSSYSQIPEISIPAGTPALSQAHYRWRSDNGSESGASYETAEDTAITNGAYIGTRRRLRMTISNGGTGSATGYTYRLEHSSTTCSVWLPVPTTATTQHWSMDLSPHVSDGTATTDSAGLTNPGGKTFTAGQVRTYQNQTSAISVSNSQFTELEYSIKSTANATTDTLYCFRLTNAGSATNFTYTQRPEITLKPNPGSPSGGGSGNAGENSGSGEARTGGGGGGGGGGTGEGSGSGGGQTGGGGGGGGGIE